jgi:hypothetical protein
LLFVRFARCQLLENRFTCWCFESTSGELVGYLRISTVSGFSRKLLQGLNRIGQFEMATICGIKARITM